jgi:hypothetical protein
LVPPRIESEAIFPLFAGFFARLASATFVFPTVLRRDIFQILSVATADAPSPPKPHSGGVASGARHTSTDDTDALFAVEVQSTRAFKNDRFAALLMKMMEKYDLMKPTVPLDTIKLVFVDAEPPDDDDDIPPK